MQLTSIDLGRPRVSSVWGAVRFAWLSRRRNSPAGHVCHCAVLLNAGEQLVDVEWLDHDRHAINLGRQPALVLDPPGSALAARGWSGLHSAAQGLHGLASDYVP